MSIGVGTYEATVSTPLIFSTSSKQGSPQVSTRFTTAEGSIDWIGSLKEGKAAEITASALSAMGYDSENDDSVVNKRVEIKTQEETWEGVTRIRVQFVNPLGGRYTEMSAADKAAAKARLKIAMAAVKAKTPQASGIAPMAGNVHAAQQGDPWDLGVLGTASGQARRDLG
jgi:hypothetical protein